MNFKRHMVKCWLPLLPIALLGLSKSAKDRKTFWAKKIYIKDKPGERKKKKRERERERRDQRPSSITNAEAHLIPAAAYRDISIKAYRSLLPV